MSFSQTLVVPPPQHDYDIFAPSWQAGVSSSQGLAKSLRNYDIESVNIEKTCEKLCSALSASRNSKQDFSSQDHEDNDNLCAVKKFNTIPFRAYTNIWFGTLKIYQQQVNTLFRLSQDLLSRSCNYDVKHLEATKRKSSLKSQKLIKKRRLTLTKSFDGSIVSTNYSELLEDLERVTQEPIQKSLEESFQTVSRSITQLQIREITIREISTTHSLEDAVDEDSGFGEATHEEIAEFLNLFHDNSSHNVKKTPTKRKSICEQEIPIKQNRYSKDSTIEPLVSKEEIVIKNNIKTSPLKRSITPTEFSETFDKNKYFENIDTPGYVSQYAYVENVDFNKTDGIKMATETIVKNKQISKRGGRKNTKKIRLIIDECTKIDTSEFMEEMKNNNTFSPKLARKRILKSYKTRKFKTALELLTRFNRRSLKLSLSLKQKIHVNHEQFKSEYLNLLREIFTKNFNNNWASEIYPKWLCFEDAAEKTNKSTTLKKLSNKKKSVEQPPADLNNLNEYLTTEAVIDDNNNNIYNLIQDLQKPENNVNMKTFKASTTIHHDWHPYGVMMNLLNLWRFNETNEIAAKTLFKLAENRFERALGFYSLLNLSKNQFVFLTTFPETIALQNIFMGKSIKITCEVVVV